MSQNRWNWKNTAASGLLLAAMGTGCGEETQTAVETDPIINGTVQNSNNYMVAVYHRTTDYEGPTPPAPEIRWPRPCTGTALTNRHILTATHCVTNDASWGAGAVALPASKFRLSTALSPGIVPVAANYTQTGSPPAGSITPQSIVVHPTADIAIIKTATTLTFPSGYKVPDIALEAVGTRSVRTVVSGYGRRSLTNGANSDNPRTETTALGAGTLRNGLSTTTATGNCTGGRLTLTPAADSTGATYHGDSGGPAFDFKPTIVVRIPGQCGPGGCPVRSSGPSASWACTTRAAISLGVTIPRTRS